ncbi:MAG: threonine aldolase family protein [Sphingopyxis sp.]|nr:threonine aldolase family protein [Sphingopyxis sp.]
MTAEWRIDLFSDTKTRPCAAMRRAMAEADCGDEQQDEDPTVALLNARVAALLGKPAALFLPSGTMANLISVLVHCKRGDEIIADRSSHLVNLETGGAAGVGGASIFPIDGEGGIFDIDQFEAAIRSPRRNAPRPRLAWVEQTTNLGGGLVWPLATLETLSSRCERHGLAVHIDGARLLNAAVADGVAPATYGALADSLWIDFTKGLGSPFGAVLAGSETFIEDARRYKHMLGGAMRQAGIMAAACHVSLDLGTAPLAQDHKNARRLADSLRAIPGIAIHHRVETNILVVDVAATGLDADAIQSGLRRAGARGGVFGPATMRLITHRDVSETDVDDFAALFGEIVRGGERKSA